MEVLLNPYCTEQQVRDEIKNNDATLQDQIIRAINQASRWIDNYKARDYFMHDYSVTPLTISVWDAITAGNRIFLPHPGVLSLASLMEGTTALALNTDYVYGWDQKRREVISLVRLGGNLSIWSEYDGWPRWGIGEAASVLTLTGKFGYAQTQYVPVTEAGDAGGQLTNWVLTGLGTAVLYWRLETTGGGNARVRLYSDAGFANMVAQGTGLASGSTVVLTAENSSGINGTVDMAYAVDDIDAANTLTPGTPVTNTAVVPVGMPQEITWAAIQIAAAMTGHNRKEVIGVDGSKESIIDRKIPQTVYDLLGRKGPILV